MIIKSNIVTSPYWAFTVWPFIVVLPKYADEPGIIAHEMVHYKEQAWITPIWWLRYIFSSKFRVAAEVRAYKAQIALRTLTVDQAAHWLIRYDSSLPLEKAKELLA